MISIVQNFICTKDVRLKILRDNLPFLVNQKASNWSVVAFLIKQKS